MFLNWFGGGDVAGGGDCHNYRPRDGSSRGCVLQELLSPGQLFGKHLDQSKETKTLVSAGNWVNIISHSLSRIDAIEEQHSKIEVIHSRTNLVRLETVPFCNINMVKNYNFLKNIIIYGTNSTPLFDTLSKYLMIDTSQLFWHLFIAKMTI